MLSWLNNSPTSPRKSTRFNSLPLLESLQKPYLALKAKRDKLEADAKKNGPDSVDNKKFFIIQDIYNSAEKLINEFNSSNANTAYETKYHLLNLISGLYGAVHPALFDTDKWNTLNKARNLLQYGANLIVHVGLVGGASVLCLTSPIGLTCVLSGVTGVCAIPAAFQSYITNSALLLIQLWVSLRDLREQLYSQFNLIAPGANHYEILGLSEGASLEDIKRNYRQLALKEHPDKNENHKELINQINVAYNTLSNAELRAQYDGQLKILASGILQPASASASTSNKPESLEIDWYPLNP